MAKCIVLLLSLLLCVFLPAPALAGIVLDSQPPTAPESLCAYGVSAAKITLHWHPAADNGGVAGYRVYRGGSQVADVTATTYTDSGLAADSVYSYQVSAYDGQGDEGPLCASVSAATFDGNAVVVHTVAELNAAVDAANYSGGARTILVADGSYTLDNMLWIEAENVVVLGQSGDRDAVTIAGQGMYGGVSHVFNVAGAYFQTAHLTLRDVCNHAIQLQLDVDNVVMRDLHILDTYEQMVKIPFDSGNMGLTSDNGLLLDSLLEYSAGIGPQYYIGGIDCHNGKYWQVRGNTFRGIRSPDSDIAEHAVHFWSSSEGTLVEDNVIINCDRGIGFGLGSRGHTGGVIRNNFIYHNSVDGNADVSIGLETAPDAQVYNNTIYMENSYPNAIEYRFSATTGVYIANNLTNKAIAARDGATGTVSSNCTSAQNAWFADTSAGELHLSGSIPQAVDQGEEIAGFTVDIDGDLRPHGAGMDIGADEYLSGSPEELNPPLLRNPQHGSLALPTALALEWQDCNSDPDEQGVQVRVKVQGGAYSYSSLDPDYEQLELSNLQTGTEYCWNVRALGNGVTTEDSPWANGGVDYGFYTMTDTQALCMCYPADGQGNLPTDLLLQWAYCGSAAASGFEVRYKPEGAGGYTILSIADPERFYYRLSGLSAGTTYLWSVRTTSKSDWLPDNPFTTRALTSTDCFLPFVREDAQFRSNLGFSNLHATAQPVTVYAYGPDGTPAAVKDYTVPANGYLPVTSIITDMGAGISVGCLRVSACGYIDTIGGPADNTSSDPSVAAVTPSTGTTLTTPIVLQSGPWTTRIAVSNATDMSCSCTFNFYSSQSQGISHSVTETIPAHGAYAVDDIIADLGASYGAYGMLEVVADRELAGFCRQYTSSHTGGLYPFYQENQQARVFYFPYVADMPDFRSNMGFISRQPGSVHVKVELFHAGALEAGKTLYLVQDRYTPMNNVIRYLKDSTVMQNMEGLVRVTACLPIYAIGGIVDNITSDPGVTGGVTALLDHGYTPVVLKSGPWRTMVVLANFHSEPTAVNLVLTDANSHATMAELAVQVPAYGLYKIEDVITALGLASGTFGRLEIDAALPVAGYVYQYTDSRAGGVYPVNAR